MTLYLSNIYYITYKLKYFSTNFGRNIMVCTMISTLKIWRITQLLNKLTQLSLKNHYMYWITIIIHGNIQQHSKRTITLNTFINIQYSDFYFLKYKTDMAKIWEQTTGQSTHQNHYMGRLDQGLNHSQQFVQVHIVYWPTPQLKPLHKCSMLQC